MPVFQINFSRPAGQIATQYYDFIRLGARDYRRVHGVLRHRRFLADEIVKLGPFELVCTASGDGHPRGGVEDRRRRRAGLHALRPRRSPPSAAGRSAYPLTGSVADVAVQRILVRQASAKTSPRSLLDDVRTAVEHFTKHPLTVSMTRRGGRLQPPVIRIDAQSMRRRIASFQRLYGG